MAKKRVEIAANDQWDVASLYSNLEEWEKDMQSYSQQEKEKKWAQLTAYRGKVSEGAQVLAQLLKLFLRLSASWSSCTLMRT